MQHSITTLGGLELWRWVGRKVRSRSSDIPTSHAIVSELIRVNVNNQTAEIKPAGHRKTERVPLSTLLPFWSGNPDLKKMSDLSKEAEADRQAEKVLIPETTILKEIPVESVKPSTRRISIENIEAGEMPLISEGVSIYEKAEDRFLQAGREFLEARKAFEHAEEDLRKLGVQFVDEQTVRVPLEIVITPEERKGPVKVRYANGRVVRGSLREALESFFSEMPVGNTQSTSDIGRRIGFKGENLSTAIHQLAQKFHLKTERDGLVILWKKTR